MNSPSSQKLHAFLAHAGIASRRASEKLIASGIVSVNGSVVTNVAERVIPGKDVVTVRGKTVELSKGPMTYYILNKPPGYVSTVHDPDRKQTVMALVPKSPRVYPVGRLDEESEGLLLLTNDGDLTYALTHPKFEFDKVYHVLIEGSPGNTALHTLREGVPLKDGVTRPAHVEVVKHERGNTWISITIHEGRHRQVRRMCGFVNLRVLRLVRQQVGPFLLGDLKLGKWRAASQDELQAARALI